MTKSSSQKIKYINSLTKRVWISVNPRCHRVV